MPYIYHANTLDPLLAAYKRVMFARDGIPLFTTDIIDAEAVEISATYYEAEGYSPTYNTTDTKGWYHIFDEGVNSGSTLETDINSAESSKNVMTRFSKSFPHENGRYAGVPLRIIAWLVANTPVMDSVRSKRAEETFIHKMVAPLIPRPWMGRDEGKGLRLKHSECIELLFVPPGSCPVAVSYSNLTGLYYDISIGKETTFFDILPKMKECGENVWARAWHESNQYSQYVSIYQVIQGFTAQALVL